MRGNLLVQLRERRRALPERLGLPDQRLLPLDPGLHLPRRQRIDVGRLPRLPPLGFDVPELLQRESMLAAEFGGLLLQGKLLGLKRRPLGHAIGFAAEPVGQIVGPADGLLVSRCQIKCIRHTPCAAPSGTRSVPNTLARKSCKAVVSIASFRQSRSTSCQPASRSLRASANSVSDGTSPSSRSRSTSRPDVNRVATGFFQLTLHAGDRRLNFGEVRSPWIERGSSADRPAHSARVATGPGGGGPSAATVLALLALRSEKFAEIERMVATVFQPASENGQKGMDELHGRP